MKPIETSYKGYRFRSRLEARWAVFFERLGVKWEYEPEGFELSNGTCYLPDFRITQMFDGYVRSKWIEIKGVSPTEEEIQKMYLLVQQTASDGWDYADGHIVWGDPCDFQVITFCAVIPDVIEPLNGIDDPDKMFITGACLFSPDPFSESDDFITTAKFAATAARSARFEHGQTPK